MSIESALRSILAGVAIGIAGVVYLSVESTLVGGVLFGIGLLTIYMFDFNLYTGKCCYIVDNPKKYIPITITAFLGNLVGTAIVGYTMRLSGSPVVEYVRYSLDSKLSHTLLESFILAIFCGLIMSIAVLGYKKQTSDFGRTIIVMLPVTVFIVSKFEHVVANMFYVSLDNYWNVDTVIFIVICALGNMLGCSILPAFNKMLPKREQ